MKLCEEVRVEAEVRRRASVGSTGVFVRSVYFSRPPSEFLDFVFLLCSASPCSFISPPLHSSRAPLRPCVCVVGMYVSSTDHGIHMYIHVGVFPTLSTYDRLPEGNARPDVRCLGLPWWAEGARHKMFQLRVGGLADTGRVDWPQLGHRALQNGFGEESRGGTSADRGIVRTTYASFPVQSFGPSDFVKFVGCFQGLSPLSYCRGLLV